MNKVGSEESEYLCMLTEKDYQTIVKRPSFSPDGNFYVVPAGKF